MRCNDKRTGGSVVRARGVTTAALLALAAPLAPPAAGAADAAAAAVTSPAQTAASTGDGTTTTAPAAAPSASAPRTSTAAPNVYVIAKPFTLPELGRQRRVRLYLPPSYTSAPQRRYPVIYMHDGQNLFDDLTSYVGEWGVDETMNALAAQTGFEAIVVGIDHGGDKRINELDPWPTARFGAGEGEAYLRFVAEVLKPYIDGHYRSRPQREHTAIVGSSMGGLISDYAIHRYPQVFGLAGVLSPSYWIAPQIYAYDEAHPPAPGARVYLYIGGREGDETVPDARRMHALLRRTLQRDGAVTLHEVPAAQHNEAAWRREFPAVVRWLFRLPPG